MGRTSLRLAAVLALASLRCAAAVGQDIISLDADRQSIDLTQYAEYLVDPTGRLTIDEVAGAAGGSFSASADRAARKSGATWVRFRLQDKGVASSRPHPSWILAIQPPFSIFLKGINFYVPRTGGGFDRVEAGSRARARPDEPPSRDFLFALPAEALKGRTLYLRLSGGTGSEAGIAVRSSLSIAREDLLYYLAYGVFYGILLAFVVYNFFLFISLRDRAYLFYVIYVIAGIVWQFWVQGQAKAFFGASPALDMPIMWFSLGNMILWGAAFASSFLSLAVARSRLRLAFGASMGAGLAVIATGIAGWDAVATAISIAMGIALPLLIVATAVFRFTRGNRPAIYLAAAWAVLAAGACSFSLMGLRVLPPSFWTVHGVAIGMAIETVLLSMALAERVRRLSLERNQFQRMQDRYLELSITDELTGLYNRRYLLSRLQSEAEHAERLDQPLCLIFLDLDGFKSVNDSMGHASGDLVLKELSAEIGSTLREGDVACRFGGEEFAIVMPGIRLRDAATAAERLRAGFEARPMRGVGGDPIRITISLGVVQAAAGEGPEDIIDRADKAMYRAKERGKNRVELDDGSERRAEVPRPGREHRGGQVDPRRAARRSPGIPSLLRARGRESLPRGLLRRHGALGLQLPGLLPNLPGGRASRPVRESPLGRPGPIALRGRRGLRAQPPRAGSHERPGLAVIP
jgi:two-component system, sensor histidine kinase LadS